MQRDLFDIHAQVKPVGVVPRWWYDPIVIPVLCSDANSMSLIPIQVEEEVTKIM
jgi:hypothetical protein